MAKLKIYTFPDLVLAQKAVPIQRVEKAFHGLADDMLETMYEAPGIGLAANQVGVLQRIIVIDTDYDLEDLPEGVPPPEGVEVLGNFVIKNRKPQIMINPEILSREESISFSEGCLSVPEYRAEVKRAKKIRVQYQNIDGLTKVLSAEGLLAVCIQHEIDHLDGKLFIDRLSPIKKDLVKKKLKQERLQEESRARSELETHFPSSASKKKRKDF